MNSAQTRPFSATLKPRDVEELIDFYFHRRLAAVVVNLLAPTRITPNQVTMLSGVTAIIAGVVIATGAHRPWQTILGAGIFLLSIVFDCADGQLARLRGISSLAGRMLDGCVDVASIAGLMVGQLGWLVASGEPLWLVFVIGWATAFSVRWHAHTYDHVKNLYVHNTEERGSSPAFPTQEEIAAEAREHQQAGRWFEVLLLRGYSRFLEFQRHGTEAGRTMSTPAERQVYRRRYRLYMRLWTFNGIGTQLFLFTVATVVAPYFPKAPLWAWLIVTIPQNLFTLAILRMGKRLDAGLEEDLARHQAVA